MSMPNFAKNTETKNFEDYLKTVNLRHGGVHLCGSKGYGKSVALKHIAWFYAQQPDTTVLICDTIQNWIHSFDTCQYYTVKENAVTEISRNVELHEDMGYLTWAKQYRIDSEPFEYLEDMLKRKRRLILYNVELQEIDLVGVFQAKIIDYLYQKQRIQKKYWKDKLPHQYVIISEETEAVFDTTILDRKIMNRTRKQYSEMANLRISMFSCSQRLTEVSLKFRGKMDSYLLTKSSLEDWDSRLTRILRFSKHRNEIPNLPIGIFLDTKTDTLVQFPDFKPNGFPYEWIPEPKAEQPIKLSVFGKLLNRLSKGKYLEELKEAKKHKSGEEPESDYTEEDDAEDRDTEDFEEEIFGEDDT